MSDPVTCDSRVLYSIKEARVLLGGISQTTLYALLRTGELASVVIGCRRFISTDAIAEFVKKATITDGPVRDNLSRNINQSTLSLRYALQFSSGHVLVDAFDPSTTSARPVLTAQPDATRRVGGGSNFQPA
jgi:hypothetical protein